MNEMRHPTIQEAQDELARRHLADFVEATLPISLHPWQRDHLCPLVERVTTETGLREAIHAPPQYGKSIVTAQRLIAYALGKNPLLRVGLACYNETHAANFGEVVRDLLRSAEFRRIFPDPQCRIPKDASAKEFSTAARTARGDGASSFVALGLNSGFTGRGVDLLVLDDPYKSDEEARSATINERVKRWWDRTADVRVGPEANVIALYHRYHDADLAAHLIEQGFRYTRFPAIADENADGADPTGRAPGELLSPMRSEAWLRTKEAQDPLTFAGQFQGTPTSDAGRVFSRADFPIVDRAPRYTRWVRYFDLATSAKQTADFTAGALVGLGPDSRLCLADMARWRREWPETRDGVRDAQGRVVEPGILGIVQADLAFIETLYDAARGERRPQYHVAVESQGMQLALVQDLQRNELFLKVPFHGNLAGGKGDKKQRAAVLSARAKAGLVALVRGPWNEAFLNEAEAFDGLGLTKDDQIDAADGAVEILYAKTGHEVRPTELPQPGSHAFYEQLGKLQSPRRR